MCVCVCVCVCEEQKLTAAAECLITEIAKFIALRNIASGIMRSSEIRICR